MGSGTREKFDNPVVEWIDSRMPIFTLLQKEYGVFPAPRNFNYFWNFGAIAMFMLVTMIVSGIVLAMHYTANVNMAFDSVERIMRDINGGWLIRYIHMNGASFFFIAVYIHMFRGMYYGSYKRPRELLWILGVVIFLLMMATAFMGYVLPWGQMSLWGATVITGFFTAIPYVGESVQTLLLGGYAVDNPTLTRFFALHYLLPFVICAVVFLHVWALHVTGSNSPLGIDITDPEKDTLPFHPYYTIKDTFGTLAFLVLYAVFVFYMPDALGHPDNYTPANPLVTPPHIVPEWYFLPFYAILRAIIFNMNLYMLAGLAILAVLMVEFVWRYSPKYLNVKLGIIMALIGSALVLFGFASDMNQQWGIPLTSAEVAPISAKLGGVLAMFGSIAILFILPWLDNHPVRSARFRPLFRIFMLLFAFSVFVLGYIGSKPADAAVMGIPLNYIGLAMTGYYFGFFLIILPLLSRFEKGSTLPASIHEAVLAKSAKAVVITVFAGLLLLPSSVKASDAHAPALPSQVWSFEGPFGTYDKASLQRGYKIYREVCAACHSMKRVYFRNLEALGYNENQIKNIAAEYTYADGPNDEGDMFERPGLPSDAFKAPFANENAARYANAGALPPDLSLITKARANGPNYVYALLTGYEPPPHGEVVPEGQHWNKYFAGHKLAMAPPLATDQVAYEDETAQTLDQYARDVTHFLTWAADPYMEERKQTGFKVIVFLIVFAGIMYAVKRKLWADQH